MKITKSELYTNLTGPLYARVINLIESDTAGIHLGHNFINVWLPADADFDLEAVLRPEGRWVIYPPQVVTATGSIKDSVYESVASFGFTYRSYKARSAEFEICDPVEFHVGDSDLSIDLVGTISDDKGDGSFEVSCFDGCMYDEYTAEVRELTKLEILR